MKKALLLIIFLSSLSFILVFGILQNYLTYKSLSKANFDRATKNSKRAIFLPKIINLLSFHQIELIRFWELSLQEIPTIKELVNNTQSYLTQTLNNEINDQELPNKIIMDLEKINNKLNKIDIKELNEIKPAINDSLVIIKKFLQTDQNYIVVLQNSDELRATGGFLGSFFVLQTQNGQILPLQIQDIYVPDGQFKGFVEAPSGVKEYLSSGKGLRLPDANWSPDFPNSAEQILYFFETVENKKYQGVIALNLNMVEQLLSLTGDIYLPDYSININQDNFAQIARADRNEFFPGSQEKANFLNHFFKMFKLKLSQTIKEKPREIIALSQKLITNKNIQFYSRDPEIAEILQRRNSDGSIHANKGLYYFLVESNVGINKANRLVNRQATIDVKDQQQKIIINFQNNSQVPYVNYQRLYTNHDTQLENVLIDGKRVSLIDQKIFTTQAGEKINEFGFLISVLAQNQTKIEINLKSQLSTELKKNIFIQKQSGLPITNYLVNYQQQSKNFELTSDQKLIFD